MSPISQSSTGVESGGVPVVLMPSVDDASAIAIGTNDGAAWTKVTPASGAHRVTIRPQTSTKYLLVATSVVHKAADTAAIAATNPAITEANSYALANELKADYNTHIASTAYHVAADAGACTLPAANDEAKLVALVNNLRTLFSTHYASIAVHGGAADEVNLALAAATTVATDAAGAIVLENLLAAYHLAHLAVTSAGIWEKLPAGTALVWQSPETPVWFQLESSGTYSVRTDS